MHPGQSQINMITTSKQVMNLNIYSIRFAVQCRHEREQFTVMKRKPQKSLKNEIPVKGGFKESNKAHAGMLQSTQMLIGLVIFTSKSTLTKES